MSKDNSEIEEETEGDESLDPDEIFDEYDIFELSESLKKAVNEEFQEFFQFQEQKTIVSKAPNNSESQKPKGRVLKVKAETLEELYTILWTVYTKDETPVVHVDFTQATVIDDQALQIIRGFEKLETLNLKGCQNITYNGLLDLKGSENLSNLKQMNLTGCNIRGNIDKLGKIITPAPNPNNLEPATNLEELSPIPIVSNATAQKVVTPTVTLHC